MKVKDLLGAQDVRIFSAGYTPIRKGEVKDIPHEYFDTMCSIAVLPLCSVIVINLK